MIKFNSHDEIKEVYDKGKHDIFYENDGVKYKVNNIGSTIYCHNTEKNMGMGGIHIFNINCFYAIEKPEPVKVEEITAEVNEDNNN